jgi:5-methylcytosine-specific restriction protein A
VLWRKGPDSPTLPDSRATLTGGPRDALGPATPLRATAPRSATISHALPLTPPPTPSVLLWGRLDREGQLAAMPWSPRGPCPVPGCRQRQPCPRHPDTPRSPWKRSNGARWRDDYGAAWPALARRVLHEEPRCRYGTLPSERDVPPCTAPSREVDHITPKARGGTDDRTNLRGLCTHHHFVKSGRDARTTIDVARRTTRPSR